MYSNESKVSRTGGNMKISLCAIVKNEENFITEFIEHHIDTVDDIFILDTGSSDMTLSKISVYEKVHIYLYNESEFSFSNARNYILNKASGDWILFLDADERLSLNKVIDIKAYLSTLDCYALCLWRYDYTPNGDWAGLFVPRIIKKDKVQYSGDVFEYLESKQKEPIMMQMTTEMYLQHIGRLRDVEMNISKNESYISKAKNVLRYCDSDDVKGYYEILIAMLYQEIQNKELAYQYLELSMNRESFCTWYRYKSAGDVYRINNDNVNALNLYKKALSKSLNNYEKAISHDMIGVCLMNMQEYPEAVNNFKYAIEFDDNLIHRLLYIVLAEAFIGGEKFSRLDNNNNLQKIIKNNPYLLNANKEINSRLRFRYDTPECYTNLIKEV